MTWKERFKKGLSNKNWKKILSHEIVEYSWLGGWYIALEGRPESWIIGISGAFIIHLVVFELVDSLHEKGVAHRFIPNWIHWMFEHDHKNNRKKV